MAIKTWQQPVSMFRKSTKLTVTFFGLLTLCGACGSELSQSEKEARASKTFDLKGRYIELTDAAGSNTEASQEAAQLNIINESGKNDLALTLSIARPIDADEAQALRHNFSVKCGLNEKEQEEIMASLSSYLKSVTLGNGRQYEFRGGENIVLDAVGKSSEAVVYSEAKKLIGWKFSETEGREINVKAYFYFTAHRDDLLLDYSVTADTDRFGKRGSSGKGLWLEFEMRRIVTDGAGTRVETESIDERQFRLRPMVLRKN